MALSGREKATILLSILGTDISSQILKLLPDDLADLITAGINNLPNPSADAITSVLEEFTQFFTLPSAAQRKAIEEPAEQRMAEVQRSPYDIVFYSQPRKTAAALSAERNSVVAFILSFFPAVNAKEVLMYLGERKKEIDQFMKGLKQTPVSESLKEKLILILAERLQRLG